MKSARTATGPCGRLGQAMSGAGATNGPPYSSPKWAFSGVIGRVRT